MLWLLEVRNTRVSLKGLWILLTVVISGMGIENSSVVLEGMLMIETLKNVSN